MRFLNCISIRGSIHQMVGRSVTLEFSFFGGIYLELGMLIPNLMFIRIYRVKFLRYDFFSYFEFIVPMTSSFLDIILLNFKFIDI